MSHFGMGAEFGSMMSGLLMVALVVFAGIFLVRLLTRRSGPAAPQPAYAGYADESVQRVSTPEIGSNLGHAAGAPAPLQWENGQTNTIPAGFDTAAFLRSAKTNFFTYASCMG